MHCFKDAEGREWILTINVSAVRRVRALAGVDLPGLVGGEGGGLGGLLEDPVKFVDVLFVLVKPDAERREVSDEDFGAALGGDTLERAAEAFIEELIDFFPASKRPPLRTMLSKGRQVAQSLLTMAGAEAAALDPEAEARKVYEVMKARHSAAASNGSSGATPAPSASTPAPSPSENSP